MPFQNVLLNSLKLGHKISEQAEHLWKEHIPHPLLTFLDLIARRWVGRQTQ